MLGIYGTCLERINAKQLGIKGAWVLVAQIEVLYVGIAVMSTVGMIETFSA